MSSLFDRPFFFFSFPPNWSRLFTLVAASAAMLRFESVMTRVDCNTLIVLEPIIINTDSTSPCLLHRVKCNGMSTCSHVRCMRAQLCVCVGISAWRGPCCELWREERAMAASKGSSNCMRANPRIFDFFPSVLGILYLATLPNASNTFSNLSSDHPRGKPVACRVHFKTSSTLSRCEHYSVTASIHPSSIWLW